MAAMAAAAAALPAETPVAPLAALAFLFGLTASGWNGVFLAEVARISPDGRVGEATGAVLTASYAGLVGGPLVIATLSAVGGLRLAYAALAIACLIAAVGLMDRR